MGAQSKLLEHRAPGSALMTWQTVGRAVCWTLALMAVEKGGHQGR